MNDHYYSADPQSAHKPLQIEVCALGLTLRFHTDAGVFSRDALDPGSRLLLEALPPLSGDVLDLGCGWGALGVTLAVKYPQARFTLSDVNSRAVALAARNLRENGVQNARALQSDGFAALEGQSFDFILTNPPIRAGKQVIYALFERAHAQLRPGGRLYLVIRKQQGAPSAVKFLEGIFESARVIERGGGYWIIECVKKEEETL